MLAAEQGWTELSAAWGWALRAYSLDGSCKKHLHLTPNVVVVMMMMMMMMMHHQHHYYPLKVSAFTKVPLSLCDFVSQLVSRCARGPASRILIGNAPGFGGYTGVA